MSHSTVLVVLSDAAVAEHGVHEALAQALEKFDENKDTPRYVKYTKEQAIEKERQDIIAYRDGLYAKYLADPEAYAKATHGAHLKYISEEFPKKLDKLDDKEFLYAEAIRWESAASIDEDGNITSTYNPNSKWDWYSIGGRWSGSVLNTVQDVHHPEVKHEHYTEPAWLERKGGEDIVRKSDLTVCHGTFAFLSKDGEWSERGRMGWFGAVADEAEPDVWDAQLKELIEKVEDEDWLVVVDVHI